MSMLILGAILLLVQDAVIIIKKSFGCLRCLSVPRPSARATRLRERRQSKSSAIAGCQMEPFHRQTRCLALMYNVEFFGVAAEKIKFRNGPSVRNDLCLHMLGGGEFGLVIVSFYAIYSFE